MGPALDIGACSGASSGASSGAGVLADHRNWLTFRNRADLVVLVAGDILLCNQSGVTALNRARHPHLKQALAHGVAAWVVSSAGQASIAACKIGGKRLFLPSAGHCCHAGSPENDGTCAPARSRSGAFDFHHTGRPACMKCCGL